MTPTAAEIQSMLIELIAGATETDPERWRDIVGEVETQPIAFAVSGNWKVHPKGKKADREIVEKAAALLREQHRYAVG